MPKVLAFSDLTCHLEDTGIDVFWCTAPPDSKEIKLGSSNHELFHQQVKTPEYFQFHGMNECVSLQLFLMVWIFRRSLGVICYNGSVLSEGHNKCVNQITLCIKATL